MKILDDLPRPEQQQVPQFVSLKSSLACDFFSKLATSHIGISDVGLDSVTAYRQAYLRALSLVSLKDGFARGMSDFFNDTNGNEQTSSNYEELCELKSSLNLPVSAIKVSDSIKLNTGELVLFLSVDTSIVKSKERMILNSRIAIYYKENTTDLSREFFNKIVVDNKLSYSDKGLVDSEKSSYIVSHNRWLSKEIVFNNKKIETNFYKTFYKTDDVCTIDTTDCRQTGTNTLDGLWYAFVNNYYHQLSGQLKDRFLKVKSVGDQYDNKTISLNRESGFFRFGSILVGAALFDNKFITRIKTNY